jgi:hypothetical protein
MHLDALSVAWNTIALTGVGFSLAVIPQYFIARNGVSSSRRNLSQRERDAATLLSHTYIWSESSRLACHLISLGLGIWSVFLPHVDSDDPRPHAIAAFGIAFILGLVAINCLTVQNSIRAYLAWRRSRGILGNTRGEKS